MLPAWLRESSSYEPATDRDGFLRKNVLSLASVLVSLRAEAACSADLGAFDRVLAKVPGRVRLLGTALMVACVSLARNMAFVWVILVGGLVVLALRPARRIGIVLVPALMGSAVAIAINVPALLLGQFSAPIRMGTKALVTVGLVANLAQALGSDGLMAALRGLGLPSLVVTAVDLALRDIVLLGESALSLSEALELRSVGRDKTKTSSAAGVMGVTFLHAHTMAVARAEAMELRGYGDSPKRTRQRVHVDAPLACYAIALCLAVALFAYLEVSLP